MKIPTRVTPSTEPTRQGMASFSVPGADANAFGAQIGQGIKNLSIGADNYLAQEKDQRQKLEDLELLRKRTEFETNYFTKTTDDLKRAAPPTGAGFRESVEQTFDAESGKFLAEVPERKKAEYQLWQAQVKQRVVGDAFRYEKTAADTYSKTIVGDETTQAKVGIDQSPDTFEAQKKRVYDKIDATTLSEIEKQSLRREADIDLAKVWYRAMDKAGKVNAANMPVAGGVDVFVNRILQVESGGNANAKNPRSSATGLGQFTTDTWVSVLRAERPDLTRGQPDEALYALRLDPQLSAEMTKAYATMNAKNLQQSGFAPTPGNIYLAHFLGPEGAKRVLGAKDEQPIQQAVGTKAFEANKEVFAQAPTVGALKAWAVEKMGGSAAQLPTIQVTKGADGYWQTPGLEYDLQGKVRSEPVSKEWVERVVPTIQSLGEGLSVRVTSAGQQPGQGTGSHRHDVDSGGHSHTADIVLMQNGKPVTPQQNPALYAKAVEELAAQGFTGIGHYAWGIHVGNGSRAIWGPDKTGASVDPAFAAAANRGWARAVDSKKDTLDVDSRMRLVPYEDRLALRADAENSAKAQLTQTRQQAVADQAQALNGLYVNLLDGKAGQADIDRMRQQGTLTDYDQINKAQRILEQRTKDLSLEEQLANKLSGNGVFDPTSKEDKDLLNAGIGTRGKEALANMDKGYFTDYVVPLVGKARDIPTDVVGTLMGMMRSTNPDRAVYALDALSQLERTDPRAYAARVNSQTQSDVEFYRLRRDTMPKDELLRAVNAGNSQEERQAREILRKEAQDLLSKRDGKVTGLDKLAEEIISDNSSFFGKAALSSQAWAAQGLKRDAQAIWITEYERTGKADDATEVTKKIMKNRWGTTELGGKKVLMELPPEKAGYKPLGGSFDWIDRQVRQENNLQPNEKYELLSDEQTSQEFAGFQRGGDRGPSYRIAVTDANGVMRMQFNENGSPKRVYFKPDSAAIQAEVDHKQEESDLQAATVAERELGLAQRNVRRTGIPVPQDVLEQNAQFIKRGEEVRARRAEKGKQASSAVTGAVNNRGLFSDIMGGEQSRYTVDPETGEIIREGNY